MPVFTHKNSQDLHVNSYCPACEQEFQLMTRLTWNPYEKLWKCLNPRCLWSGNPLGAKLKSPKRASL